MRKIRDHAMHDTVLFPQKSSDFQNALFDRTPLRNVKKMSRLIYCKKSIKQIFLVQNEDIKDICLALPCNALPCLALPR
jgi:hypothetical protein